MKTLAPYLIILFWLLTSETVRSQIVDTLSTDRNVWYLEGVGVGGYGSLNYERLLLTRKEIRIAGRIGFSTYNLKDYTLSFNPSLIFPIGISASYGRRHGLHLGLGQVVSSTVSANAINFKPERNTRLHTYFEIGYQFQMKRIPLLFRLNYTPILERNKTFRHWGGLAVGYVF